MCSLRIGLIALLIVNSFYSCNSKPEEAYKKESIEDRIRSSTKSWMGTPYQMGGTSKDGVDCSAFTQVIIKEVFDIDLPRRVKDQKSFGQDIPREEMKSGDLVVFKTGVFISGKQHIGIYLSDNKFVHASSSKRCNHLQFERKLLEQEI